MVVFGEVIERSRRGQGTHSQEHRLEVQTQSLCSPQLLSGQINSEPSCFLVLLHPGLAGLAELHFLEL